MPGGIFLSTPGIPITLACKSNAGGKEISPPFFYLLTPRLFFESFKPSEEIQPKIHMKTINHSQLLELVKNQSGAKPVGFTALTDAKARKTGNPFGLIYKQIRAVGFVGADYQKAVQREASRQNVNGESFQADSLPWGEWLVPNKVISHKGSLYLRTQTTPGQRKRQAARLLAYRGADGRFLSPDAVKPFLPPANDSAKQSAIGLEGKVMVRTYAFASLQKVRINGRTYQVKAD